MNDVLVALDTPADVVRHVSALLCLLAFGGMMWRLIGWWDVLRPLSRYGLTLFAVLLLIVGLGSARRAALGGPLNEAQLFIILHAVATLVFLAAWPRLVRRL